MDLSRYFIDYFTTQGVYKGKQSYADLVDEFGLPRAVSSNGRVYLFKQPNDLIFNICVLEEQGMTHSKTIDFLKDLSYFKVHDLLDEKNIERRDDVLEDVETGIFADLKDVFKFKYEFDVTDQMDFALKITPMTQKEKEETSKINIKLERLKTKVKMKNNKERASELWKDIENLKSKLRKKGSLYYIQRGVQNLEKNFFYGREGKLRQSEHS